MVGLAAAARLASTASTICARALPRQRSRSLRSQFILRAPRDLGGDHHLVAHLARVEPSADDRLGAALRLRLRRDGVDLRGVEEVDAALDRIVHLRVAFGLGVLLAEGHGAERERAHLYAGPAEFPILHAALQPEAEVYPSLGLIARPSAIPSGLLLTTAQQAEAGSKLRHAACISWISWNGEASAGPRKAMSSLDSDASILSMGKALAEREALLDPFVGAMPEAAGVTQFRPAGSRIGAILPDSGGSLSLSVTTDLGAVEADWQALAERAAISPYQRYDLAAAWLRSCRPGRRLQPAHRRGPRRDRQGRHDPAVRGAAAIWDRHRDLSRRLAFQFEPAACRSASAVGRRRCLGLARCLRQGRGRRSRAAAQPAGALEGDAASRSFACRITARLTMSGWSSSTAISTPICCANFRAKCAQSCGARP